MYRNWIQRNGREEVVLLTGDNNFEMSIFFYVDADHMTEIASNKLGVLSVVNWTTYTALLSGMFRDEASQVKCKIQPRKMFT